MPNGPLATRVFVVATRGDGISEPRHTARRIEAAYYRTDGDFTTFKDDTNAAVFTVRNDHLVSVERSEGADPITADLMALAATAQEKGHAHGVITWETSDHPGGRVYRTGLDVTIALTGEVSSGPR